MSWQASAWAKKTRGMKSFGEKLVLMVLADYAHPESWIAWPSQDTLADDCEMSRRHVIRCIHSLETQGFLTQLRRGSKHSPSVYQLNGYKQLSVDVQHATIQGNTISDRMSHIPDEALLVTSEPVNVTSETSQGDTHVTLTVKEPTTEPPIWWQTFQNDKRWPDVVDSNWVADMEALASKTSKDIELEALKAYSWLESKGKRKRDLKRFWANWLANTSFNGSASTARTHQPNRLANMKEAKRRHESG